MPKIYTTKSYRQTQKLGENLAKEILLSRTSQNPPAGGAVVIGLQGNLGGGKTTFLQGFAKGLEIKEKILSPTFVILKHFEIPRGHSLDNRRPSIIQRTHFYHIDCYRLKNEKDILELFSAQGGPASGWKEIISDPKNIVAIEWSEKIKKVLPREMVLIEFKFVDKNKREIIFKTW